MNKPQPALHLNSRLTQNYKRLLELLKSSEQQKGRSVAAAPASRYRSFSPAETAPKGYRSAVHDQLKRTFGSSAVTGIRGYDDVSLRSNEAIRLGADKPKLTLVNGSDARASAHVPIEADFVDARTKSAGRHRALRASNGDGLIRIDSDDGPEGLQKPSSR